LFPEKQCFDRKENTKTEGQAGEQYGEEKNCFIVKCTSNPPFHLSSSRVIQENHMSNKGTESEDNGTSHCDMEKIVDLPKGIAAGWRKEWEKKTRGKDWKLEKTLVNVLEFFFFIYSFSD